MFYPIRSFYPELKPLPWKLRWAVIKRVCENPMSRSRAPKLLVGIGTVVGLVSMVTAIYLTLGTFSMNNDVVVVMAAVLALLPFCIAAYVVKVIDDRKSFLIWLENHTYNQRSHFCLNCWQPLHDLDREDCPHCSQQQFTFNTDRQGTALPLEEATEETPELQLPAIELPDKTDREAISYFLQGKKPPEAEFWYAMTEPLAYAVIFGLPISIGVVIYSPTYRWYAMAAAIAIISLAGIAGYRIQRTTRAHSKRAIKKYCPDGVAPWCIYCDYDLRGRIESSCPECGKPIFVYDFKWRPWKFRRSRPEK